MERRKAMEVLLQMRLLSVIFSIQMVSMLQASIYLYDAEDSASVEVYDCLYHESMLYCRRPSQPIILQRDNGTHLCHHGGISHSFFSLWQKNVSVYDVLHGWRSSLDKAEEYAHYRLHANKSNETTTTGEFLCQCNHSASFGSHCEYRLPVGTTFDETVFAKFWGNTTKLMYGGDIVCYTTLECNSGLLCLDWRDICDGQQQCMSGTDEENCDKLEFNECEDDEYRCENGMCIPDEYFLDGDYDCMDLSDEREPFNGTQCPFQAAGFECDDRICPRNLWSCGDGQCVSIAARFPISSAGGISCMNRRDQFFWCETVVNETLWTLPNGRCSVLENLDEQNIINYCHYLRICMLSAHTKKDCSCHRSGHNCSELFRNNCSSWNVIHYPAGALIAPYIFGYYNDTFLQPSSRHWKLNGTIKCREYQMTFSTTWTAISVDNLYRESRICESSGNGFVKSAEGYNPFCHNSSRTFNNRSYNILNSCLGSQMCPSVYRIENRRSHCDAPAYDVLSSEFVEKSCYNVRRHRFRCSSAESTCYYASELGNSISRCENENDEYSIITQQTLTRTQCNKNVKTDCESLRRHSEASWNTSIYNGSRVESSLARKVPFRVHCDTFQDTLSNEDESAAECRSSWICVRGQWQCHNGHCIDPTWVLDGQVDCGDGSDEESIFAFGLHPHNQKYSSIPLSFYAAKIHEYNPLLLLWSVCNSTLELPCSSKNISAAHAEKHHCINATSTNVHEIDCLSECDEQTVIDHCYRSLVALGYHPQCISMQTCFMYSSMFENISASRSNQRPHSTVCNNSRSCWPTIHFACWDGKLGYRCNHVPECEQHEDEYMCPQNDSAHKSSRRETKKLYFRTRSKDLRLRQYPPNAIAANVSLLNSPIMQKKLQFQTTNPFINSSIFTQCNRGIPIHHYNHTVVCFCPSQYHGDQCQYHTGRITFRLHINFNYSSYTINSDATIVNKYLLLLLYDDEVISTDEYHLRPSTDILKYLKKLIYLSYPNDNDSIAQKQKRYFNRSNVIHHHPYSIRMEAYEMTAEVKPRRFAVWQYPIYFDFLPVYRLAKVLRFVDQRQSSFDPCREQPCGVNEECYQLQNEPSRRLCLCKSNFSGPNCSVPSVVCAQDYCTSNAVCQPGYRGVINGKEWPYCICPLNHIGQRCALIPDVCKEDPCANNGTCYQRSKPNEYKCECTEEYAGKTCKERVRIAHLNLKENMTLAAAGMVIQAFDVHSVTLELTRVHQSIYSTLPRSFRYPHGDRIAPALILLKLYLRESKSLHLLSVQINQTSINADVSIDEDNQCKPTSELLARDDSKSPDALLGQVPFIYHSLCLNGSGRLCFYDDYYLCVCNTHQLGVECFIYDHELDLCDKCLFGGRCLKAESDEFLCICPSCHTGKRCQFNFESFSFTLDQLFYNDLLSPDVMIRQVTFYSLILGPCVLLMIGLINNLCCFVTFRRSKCLRNGIGHYLLSMTIINQINLACLVIRFTHLTVNIASPYSLRQFDMIFCKLSNYFLVTSTRLAQWLCSLIAIERLYVVVFLNGNWLKKPHIARRILIVTTLIILIVTAYELAFIELQNSSDNGINSICVMTFPLGSRVWHPLHFTVTLIDSLTPFLINLVCTIGIICIVTKKKMNANTRDHCRYSWGSMGQLFFVQCCSLFSFSYSDKYGVWSERCRGSRRRTNIRFDITPRAECWAKR